MNISGNSIHLRDVDVGVLVPDKVNVGCGKILTDKMPSCATNFIKPLACSIINECNTSFRSEAVRFDDAVGLTRGPVVVLKV